MPLGTSGQSPTPSSDPDSDVDSLFDEPSTHSLQAAIRLAPQIPGLFVPPVLLSQELEGQIVQECMRLYFTGRRRLPSFLIQLLHQLSTMLQPWIPADLHDLLFPSKGAPARARQAILNLYQFDDGIIGSQLEQRLCHNQNRWDLYLPERSILILSKDARYNWTHEIPGKTHDLVESEDESHGPHLIRRGTRLSITFRWLLPGADVVGEPEP
ncbi:hypothetical protein BU15DRAFT_90013 [Melanogaster broomeanus]|nr:hypothetical protein BU15DRAFT_90013 [Melanogaster broomeanus]